MRGLPGVEFDPAIVMASAFHLLFFSFPVLLITKPVLR